MGKSKKQVAKNSKETKEVLGIEIVSDPITTDEEKQVGPIPMFSELSFVFWNDKMEAYLQAHGYDVWQSVVSGDASANESRRYNTKATNVIRIILPGTVKAKVNRCSSARSLRKKLHDLYSKKHVAQ